MSAPSRPETVDQYGTRHRYGCTLPGWESSSPRVAGVHVLRCAGCGAVRLLVAGKGDR